MPTYSIPGFQEPFSSFSHLFAAPFFLVWGIVLMMRYAKYPRHLASLTLLSLGTVFLLSMSGVYHLLGQGAAKNVLKLLDIAGVFGLIAATANAVHMSVFYGLLRWLPVCGIWVVAATGISLRTIFSESLPFGVGTSIFLFLGWGGIITCGLLWRRHGFQFIRLLLVGGLAYSLGAVILIFDAPTAIPGVVGPHEIWHLAVLLGLTLHWLFVEVCIQKAIEIDGETLLKEGIDASLI